MIISLKTWENIIDIFTYQVSSVEYKHIMGVIGLTINSPLGRSRHEKCVKLVDQLIKRKKTLEQIKGIEEEKY